MDRSSAQRKRRRSSNGVPGQTKYSKSRVGGSRSNIQARDPAPPTEEKTQNPVFLQPASPPASPWTTPLCHLCRAIFSQWNDFLQDTSFQVPHHDCWAELKASADRGCSLCTQFMYSYRMNRLRSPVIREMGVENDSDCSESEGLPRRANSSKSSRTDRITRGMGGVTISLPGEGDGDIEYTHRLHLKFVSERDVIVSMVPADAQSKYSELINRNEQMKNSNTKDSIRLCKDWLVKCLDNHKVCADSYLDFVPNRLVDVRERTPRLTTLSELAVMPKYATLSHCWGSSSFPTLTKANLSSFRERIPETALSKTFSDSILVCKELELDYIWIDSLCIVQDDPDDWATEAALMTKVYGSSTINIAAFGASDGGFGLFFDRSSSWRCHAVISSSTVPKLYNCVPFGMHEGSFLGQPLSTRGWTFQEKLLPTRTLMFTSTQVFWECHEDIACEVFPDSYPRELRGHGHGQLAEFLSNKILKKPIHDLDWDNVVTEYTGRNLSFARDRLVAISGLARQIQSHTKDEYCAGMWRQNLEIQLCWHIWSSKWVPSRSQQRVPTWSWGSVDAPVTTTGKPRGRDQVLIKIQDLCVEPNEDRFGATSSARLSLSCSHVIAGTLQIRGSGWITYLNSYNCMITTAENVVETHVIFDELDSVDLAGLFYFLQMRIYNDNVSTNLQGLILESAGTEPGNFRRVGLFMDETRLTATSSLPDMPSDKLFADTKAQCGDEMYTRIFEDENGVTWKDITLV